MRPDQMPRQPFPADQDPAMLPEDVREYVPCGKRVAVVPLDDAEARG